MASIIEDNRDKFILIAGDFNSDLLRGRRYDNLLNEFIIEHELDCYDQMFGNELKTTYRNGDYRSHIDHIIGMRKHLNMVEKCEIMVDELNMSDHNAIRVKIIGLNNLLNHESNEEKTKLFHKFAWNNSNFVNKYKEIVSESINKFEIDLQNNYNYDQQCEYIDNKLQDLSKMLLQQSARKAENQTFKKNMKNSSLNLIWNEELRQNHERLWKYHSHYKSTGCEKSKFLWKFFKNKMRNMEKDELIKKNKSKIIDLEKLKRVKRNEFWKKIKNSKRKSGKKTSNDKLDFDKFSSLYSKLFFNDIIDSDEHIRIKQVVENKCNDLKNEICEDVFENDDIERAIKKLKSGKSTGFIELLFNCFYFPVIYL